MTLVWQACFRDIEKIIEAADRRDILCLTDFFMRCVLEVLTCMKKEKKSSVLNEIDNVFDQLQGKMPTEK